MHFFYCTSSGCGIVQSHYAFKNISDKAQTTVHYFVSMLSSTMDCIIFLYLGVALLDLGFHPEDYFWYPGFIIWTLVLCLLVRFIGIYLLTGLSNSFRSACHIMVEVLSPEFVLLAIL